MINKLFIDGKLREFVPYKGWFDEDGVRDPLMDRSQDEGPLERTSVPYALRYNLLDKNGYSILPKDCRHIDWYPQGYYIACCHYMEFVNEYFGSSLRQHDHFYWIVRADGTLVTERPFFEAKPATFDRVWVKDAGNQSFLLSLDGSLQSCASVLPIGVSGWFLLSDEGKQTIVNSAGNIVASNIELIDYDSEILIYRKHGKFVVVDYNGAILCDDFSSILTANKSGLWEISYIHRDMASVTWLYCQPHNDFIIYAHEVLLSYDRLALLEKEGVWYYYDVNHQLQKCCSFSPDDIILPYHH